MKSHDSQLYIQNKFFKKKLKFLRAILYIIRKQVGKRRRKKMIVKQYEVGSFSVFCYLIGDEETKEGLFIDPSDDAERLLSEAKSRGIPKIKYIVNTHCHVDHIMGNAEMKKKTGAKLVIHEADAPYGCHPFCWRGGEDRFPGKLLGFDGGIHPGKALCLAGGNVVFPGHNY